MWQLSKSVSDWAYPNSVDFVLYKKIDALSQISRLNFTSPNTLEAEWATKFSANASQFGLCYEHSKIVNNPCNLVQKDWKNPHSNTYDINYLLKLFMDGFKIDISKFYKFENNCAHFDVQYEFINRG